MDLVFNLASPASPADYLHHPVETLARRELGWTPQVGLRQGLERTIAYFRTRKAPSLVRVARSLA